MVTDVVRENNQTYRLGWSDCCKDGTKMGVGCPEYILLSLGNNRQTIQKALRMKEYQNQKKNTRVRNGRLMHMAIGDHPVTGW
ncbi:MAG: hypothetical protein ACLR78_04845 [Roseburia sp.]